MRDISATNRAQIDASHLHEVVLVKLEWDEPAYVHSGFGTISYDGDDYLGVGGFGSITNARESEVLGPLPITLTLSGVDSAFISLALTSVAYRDVVTVYCGYRQDDGDLVDDPWIVWNGWFEFASISQDDSSVISITCQHDLAVLDEISGARFSDEDQKDTYASDDGFEFVHEIPSLRLVWRGRELVWAPSFGNSTPFSNAQRH